MDVGHGLVTLLSLSVSVKDRSLHKTLGKSQIYYPEHILEYGRLEDLLLSCCGFGSFRTDCQGFYFGGGGPYTALSPGLRGGDEDISTSSHTSQGEEEVQHGRPIHLFHGGGLVQLKLEPISGSRTSLP